MHNCLDISYFLLPGALWKKANEQNPSHFQRGLAILTQWRVTYSRLRLSSRWFYICLLNTLIFFLGLLYNLLDLPLQSELLLFLLRTQVLHYAFEDLRENCIDLVPFGMWSYGWPLKELLFWLHTKRRKRDIFEPDRSDVTSKEVCLPRDRHVLS